MAKSNYGSISTDFVKLATMTLFHNFVRLPVELEYRPRMQKES